MWGHSGGGFITADAMFRYPDFFKVGIAESGNHDQREYEDDWGERYQGLLTKTADGPDSYEAEANQSVAKNLKGHLLLAHGTMDNNVPPVQHAARRGRAHQGEQGLRSPDAAEPGARLRRRIELHDAAALGLFRQTPPRGGSAEGIPDGGAGGRARRGELIGVDHRTSIGANQSGEQRPEVTTTDRTATKRAPMTH